MELMKLVRNFGYLMFLVFILSVGSKYYQRSEANYKNRDVATYFRYEKTGIDQKEFIEKLVKENCQNSINVTHGTSVDIKISCKNDITISKRKSPFQSKLNIYKISSVIDKFKTSIVEFECWNDSAEKCVPYLPVVEEALVSSKNYLLDSPKSEIDFLFRK